MENLGFVFIHRKIKDKCYYKKSQYVHLWLHLLLCANHKENKFLWNGKEETLRSGQLITGRKQLSEDTGIAETTVSRILTLFEKERQIGQQTNNKFRIITIENWKEYQQSGFKADNRRTSSGQQTDTNNNVKNVNNDNNTKQPVVADNINNLIELFKEVNPSYKQLYSNKTQRSALERMLKFMGQDKLEGAIKILRQTSKMEFAPHIFTPYELEKKLGALIAFVKKEQIKTTNSKIIKL